MADTKKTIADIESATAMVEQLGNAFKELESHRQSSLQNKTQWEDIKEHFNDLEKSLKKKLDEVEEKERAFKEKQSESQRMLAEREADVTAKEYTSLDRLQELKDTAVFAVVEARKECKVEPPMLADSKGSKGNKVSSSGSDDPNAPIPAPEKDLPDNKSGEPAEAVAGELKPRPQLKELCEQMNGRGVLEFLLQNKKNLANVREELSIALKSASEPARLVLDTLEGFYPPDQSNPEVSSEKDNDLLGLRRACLVVLETAAPLLGLAEPPPGGDHPVSFEIKQQAKAIADEWKPKLGGVDVDASNGYSLEAQAFLQLLATFSIGAEFDEDELCKLILAVSRRRQAPEVCRSIGLTHKMPGVVETLVNSGRQIDAVHFAHAFQLTESFPPVRLLKEYLDLKKNSQENSGNPGTVSAQKDPNTQELGALKVVIKCIEEYKLQEEYPVDPLKKRLAQLEKAKYDKKRMGEAVKFQQAKKPRANGGYASRKPVVPADNLQLPPTVYDDRGFYPAVAERYPERYPYTAPHSYEVASQAPYGQQANVQMPYHYPDERVPPSAPYGVSSNYGGYMSTGYQSSTTDNYGNYMGTGYQSSAPDNYGNYMGTGAQSTTPSNFGSYAGTGMQPSHQSFM